ncbi:unnamed protein product [Acanthosepion pharaonis]|uniref:Uncharacterized protein n=1 Tax=Acanthosepion pharaonis TaxID=158019 RepID=A0A812BXB3_ACAPH|nr:unnamed protein product [Sepia pharaonis]
MSASCLTKTFKAKERLYQNVPQNFHFDLLCLGDFFFLYLKRRQVANPPPPPAILRLTLYRQHEPLFPLTVNRQLPQSPYPPRPYLVHHLDGLRHHPNPVLQLSFLPFVVSMSFELAKIKFHAKFTRFSLRRPLAKTTYTLLVYWVLYLRRTFFRFLLFLLTTPYLNLYLILPEFFLYYFVIFFSFAFFLVMICLYFFSFQFFFLSSHHFIRNCSSILFLCQSLFL